MLRVGLTGGIGAGKSEVARRFAALGAAVIDSDAVAREVVETGTPGHRAVVAEFGQSVVHPDGSLDREQLARIVFADDAARRRLNAIVHPLVGERVAVLTERAAREHPDGVVITDVPLLVEAGLADRFDVVVVVDAPVEVALERLVTRRGMTEADARARIAAQASREQRLAVADYVIDNSGDLDALDRAVRDVWEALADRGRSG